MGGKFAGGGNRPFAAGCPGHSAFSQGAEDQFLLSVAKNHRVLHVGGSVHCAASSAAVSTARACPASAWRHAYTGSLPRTASAAAAARSRYGIWQRGSGSTSLRLFPFYAFLYPQAVVNVFQMTAYGPALSSKRPCTINRTAGAYHLTAPSHQAGPGLIGVDGRRYRTDFSAVRKTIA